jgi:ligand-binding sensor domain-containing protein
MSYAEKEDVVMLKRLIPVVTLIVGLTAAGAFAQRGGALRGADSVSFERPNEFKIFAAPEAVKAFAVRGNDLWYATSRVLVLQPMNSARNTPFQTIGAIPAREISAIAIDGQGNVWVAAEGGVAVRRGTNFTSYTAAEGLPEGAVTCLTIGAHGDVWVGTDNGAARFAAGSWTKFTTDQGLPSNKVQALIGDTRGNIYIGTNRGLSVYNGSSFENYNHRNTSPGGLEWNDIKVLAREPEGDAIWMTDGPRNISRFAGGKWEQFREIHPGITSIMNDTRRTWFGSPTGVLRFNGEEWVTDPNMHGVPAQEVYAMFRDMNGNLWFGMEKGVMMLNNPYRR